MAGIFGRAALAAEKPADIGGPIHFNLAGGNMGFNSLSAAERSELVALPAEQSQPQRARRDWNRGKERNCEALEQQYKGVVYREPIIVPDFYPNADLSRTYPGEPYRDPNGPRPGVRNPDSIQRDSSLLDFFLGSNHAPPSERERLRTRYSSACAK
ncbi:hypothetical protein LT85_1509 [Collimonas arenae]|uniref:Uncharacterized protein n=1 Tax=Collimonas arenae TaxID=279058 RepID=A0A0A1FCV0_9BURK|nr:hypothetical protein LT85_1509 [Collimonas arenae]